MRVVVHADSAQPDFADLVTVATTDSVEDSCNNTITHLTTTFIHIMEAVRSFTANLSHEVLYFTKKSS